MKKAAVVGLYSIKNAGDVILCHCTAWQINRICPEAEIVKVDVNPVNLKYKGPKRQLLRMRDFFFRGLQRVDRDLFSYRNHSAFRYWTEYFMWRLQNFRRYRKLLSDVDAIVFAGGGFLKFRTQGLNYHVEQILSIAAKKGIPVMMNGVGIEGYDDTDIRCRRLKKAINQDVVKVITTRDDIRVLQDNYIENPAIITAQVGDPALWVKECYADRLGTADDEEEDEEPRADSGTYIGINVIRGKVYQDYGNSLSEFELLNLYKQLILALEERGMRWRLFSNGMKADNTFGKKLLRALGRRASLLSVPKTPVAFTRHLQTYDCIIGARLHACIVAYATDVPVVGFIWNDKTKFFAEYTGRTDFYFDEAHLNVETLVDAVERSIPVPYDQTVRDRLRQKTIEYLSPFVEEYIAGVRKERL